MYTHILQYKNPVQAAYLTAQCHLWLLLIWLLLTSVCNYKASLFVYFLFVAVDIRCFLRSSREVVILLPCSCLRPRQYYLDYALDIHYIASLTRTHTAFFTTLADMKHHWASSLLRGLYSTRKAVLPTLYQPRPTVLYAASHVHKTIHFEIHQCLQRCLPFTYSREQILL